MSKATARNVLVVIGTWTCSNVIAFFLITLIVVIHNRMTFTGDAGIVMMWLWEGLPYDLVAVLAAIALVWVIETRKPLRWVIGLAALYLYGEGMHAWRALTHGWHLPPRTPDYIGILTRAIIPPLVCLIVGIWWTKRSAVQRLSPRKLLRYRLKCSNARKRRPKSAYLCNRLTTLERSHARIAGDETKEGAGTFYACIRY